MKVFVLQVKWLPELCLAVLMEQSLYFLCNYPSSTHFSK